MSAFHGLRLYHAAVAALTVAAYAAEDARALHVWIGYGLAGLVVTRVALAALGLRVLPRPAWLLRKEDNRPALALANPMISKAFVCGIMLALTATLATGIMLDQTPAVSARTQAFLSQGVVVNAAQADERKEKSARTKSGKILKEVHEFAANATLLLAGAHVALLLLTRPPYALKMMFLKS